MIDKKKECCGCTACVVACTSQCITMITDEEGFKYPKINKNKCVKCLVCLKVCPLKKTERGDFSNVLKCYASYYTNDDVREKSSSGGIFSLLAEGIIRQNGVVCGAGFDENLDVVHKCVVNTSQISELRGSKYVQSSMGDLFVQVRKYLNTGRKVLFSGTPCQVAGLKAYLGEDYDNLICLDIVCHGVPTSLVYHKYIEYREKQSKGKLHHIEFRNKVTGWKNYSVKLNFENGKDYQKKWGYDTYISAFLGDLCLRPSCYNCSFKGFNSQADITLGDFWGIEQYVPEMYDDKGCSLVILRSDKGNSVYKKIREYVKDKEVPYQMVCQSNPCLLKSVEKPKRREKFLKEIAKSNNFDKTVCKFCKPSFMSRVKNKLLLVMNK